MEDKSKCPICNSPYYARALGNMVENDDTPDHETVLYYVQELTCSNKKCNHVEQIKHKQEIIR